MKYFSSEDDIINWIKENTENNNIKWDNIIEGRRKIFYGKSNNYDIIIENIYNVIYNIEINNCFIQICDNIYNFKKMFKEVCLYADWK